MRQCLGDLGVAVGGGNFKNRSAEINAVQPLFLKQRQRQNIGRKQHRGIVRQHAAAHKHQRLGSLMGQPQAAQHIRVGRLLGHGQAVAVGFLADGADHLVEFQLFVHAVFHVGNIAVDQRADAAHALQISGAFQLAQGIAHRGAAQPQKLGKLHLAGQLLCLGIHAVAQLICQPVGSSAAAQLTAKAGFGFFFHSANSFRARQMSARQHLSQ